MVTLADLIEAIKNLVTGSDLNLPWQEGGAARAALREELIPDHVSMDNSWISETDLRRTFLGIHETFVTGYRRYVNPADMWVWSDAARSRRYTVQGNFDQLRTKRSFRYGSVAIQVQIPDWAASWTVIYLGFEPHFGTVYGEALWLFNKALSTTWIEVKGSPNGTLMGLDVSPLIANPTTAGRFYVTKINRASVEFWTGDAQLVGIIQVVPGADSYNVRTTAPYVLAQTGGQLFHSSPALLEVNVPAGTAVGSTPGFIAAAMSIMDGDPAPPRTLHPITGGVNWEGTIIAAGTLTSDRIPIAGYDNKTITFIATGAGTLLIDVDYGDNNNDQYDSITVVANTLVSYTMTGNPLWLRLRFTPSGFPTTVTRARALMS